MNEKYCPYHGSIQTEALAVGWTHDSKVFRISRMTRVMTAEKEEYRLSWDISSSNNDVDEPDGR
jgi:hypothetical protein